MVPILHEDPALEPTEIDAGPAWRRSVDHP